MDMSSDVVNFYNRYHKKNSDFFKVIDDNNVTYFYIIPVLKRVLRRLYNNIDIKRARALDVGCGVGTLSFYLAEKGLLVEAFDLSDAAIKICQRFKRFSKTNNVMFSQAKINTISSKKRFNLIICSEVIEHVEDDKAFLKQLSLLCVKNGTLILSTPSINAPLYKLGLLNKFDSEVGHLRRYDEKTLRNIVLNAGFKIEMIYKQEGIIRNFLYTIKPFGFLLKFIKGPLVSVFHYFDKLSVKLFGESDFLLIATKK